MKLKINESILTEEAFKESKLHPQNTIDGSQLLGKPKEDIIPNSIFCVTPCMGTLMLS